MAAKFLLAALLLAAASAAAQSAPAAGAASAHALAISSGDLLEVELFDTPELSSKLRVDEHGAIELPLAGALGVGGMTASQAGDAVAQRLRQREVLKDPQVSVTVLEYATQGVTVLGEVRNPGIYPLLGDHTLLDLISAAGGVTPSAGKTVSITHRADPDHPRLASLEPGPGGPADSNPDIEPRDTIVVARAGVVYVVGDVGKPGGFLIQNNDRLTVLQAIALAQGANKTAALNRAKLIRKTSSQRQELAVPLKKILASQSEDLPLADGDILFVPSSQQKNFAYRSLEAAIQMATGVIVYGRY